MKFFKALIGGLLVAAVSILALPMGHNMPRSLSVDSMGDSIFTRAIPVTFHEDVPTADRPAITAQVHAHHASLPVGHEQKRAVVAHVFKGYHFTPGEEHQGEHATIRYFRRFKMRTRTQLGPGVHLPKPTRRSLDDQ